jgi:hypothetical protein
MSAKIALSLVTDKVFVWDVKGELAAEVSTEKSCHFPSQTCSGFARNTT